MNTITLTGYISGDTFAVPVEDAEQVTGHFNWDEYDFSAYPGLLALNMAKVLKHLLPTADSGTQPKPMQFTITVEAIPATIPQVTTEAADKLKFHQEAARKR